MSQLCLVILKKLHPIFETISLFDTLFWSHFISHFFPYFFAGLRQPRIKGCTWHTVRAHSYRLCILHTAMNTACALNTRMVKLCRFTNCRVGKPYKLNVWTGLTPFFIRYCTRNIDTLRYPVVWMSQQELNPSDAHKAFDDSDLGDLPPLVEDVLIWLLPSDEANVKAQSTPSLPSSPVPSASELLSESESSSHVPDAATYDTSSPHGSTSSLEGNAEIASLSDSPIIFFMDPNALLSGWTLNGERKVLLWIPSLKGKTLTVSEKCYFKGTANKPPSWDHWEYLLHVEAIYKDVCLRL